MANVLAMVTFKIYPAEMGGQKGVALFYKHLAAHHSILLALSKDNGTAGENTFPLLYSNRQLMKNIFRIGQVEKIAANNNVALIIAEHSYPAWLAWRVAKRCRLPFIIHSHNIEALRFRKMNRWWWRIYLQYERWIHRKADHNFFISQEDQQFAVNRFGLEASRCNVITYGVEDGLSFSEKQHQGNVFLFNGSLDYQPNAQAVELLIDHIIPGLEQKTAQFKVLITGKGASAQLLEKMDQCLHVDYRGYVDDLQGLLAGVAVFLNPVLNDTGVKTKIIEALAAHCTVVSTESGACGMKKEVCGQKLKLVKDGDWDAFAETVLAAAVAPPAETPPEFFRTYSWKSIAKEAAEAISETIDRFEPPRSD